MRIQNNITAMNTHRQYTINNDNVAKNAEKLSSGYRINRAGDDAAGLAISEKMRSQIRGLNMATKNSQDAISLVQTAEGALQETHSMLQRMNELAVQAATGTNEDLDRTALAKEFEQLKREINDVAEQTNFNNMKILDGSLSYEGYKRSAATAGVNFSVETNTTVAEKAIQSVTVPAAAESASSGAGAKAAVQIADSTSLEAGKSYEISITINGEKATLTNAAGQPTDGKITADSTKKSFDLLDGMKFATADGKSFTISKTTTGVKVEADSEFDFDFSKDEIEIKIDKYTDANINGGSISDKANLTTIKSSGTSAAGTLADGKFTNGVGPHAGNDVSTRLTVDQDKVVNGDSLSIGGKTYTFFTKAGTDATGDYGLDSDGNKVYGGNGSTNIVFDSTKPGDLVAQLANKMGDTTNGTAISSTNAAAAPTITTAGNDITITASVKTATPTAGDPLKDYNTDAETAEKLTKDLSGTFNTKSTKDSSKTTVEFDIAKMKDGDKFTISVEGKKIEIAAFSSTDTRESYMKKVDDAIKKAGFGEVKGNAIIFEDKLVDKIDLEWNEKLGEDTNAIRIQVGALENEQLSVSIDSMNTKGLGLDDATLTRAGASTNENQDLAGAAITATRNAINKVSNQRATLGAMQNRLDHKIANLKVASENLSASESRIRDVDMASEMTQFTKNNILSQAATAMLAQANSLPQNVLSLLG